jgi:hypothetical protein
MTTTAELIDWLKSSSHIRTVLVEVAGVVVAPATTQTFYMSSRPYTADNNQYYDPCITSGISFSEDINLRGGVANTSYGDIQIDNTNGIKDEWLNYIWTNKPVNIYIGDPRWSISDYYLIFTGVISDIVSRDRNSINLVLIDKSQKLNNPISEEYFTDNVLTGDSQLKPQTFGECFNVTPILTNRIPAILEYCVHTGTVESIIEVRDNGLPVSFYSQGDTITIGVDSYTVDQGCFALQQSPFGQITCSVQGHKNPTYYNTVPNLIQEILTNIVPANIQITTGDIDTTNFTTINTNNPYPVGYYSESTTNAWELCNKLANSIGCQLYFNTLGKLTLVKVDLTGNGNSPHIITEDDFVEKTLRIKDKTIVQGTTKVAYCKNWTVQESGLAGGVPADSAYLFENEWIFSTISNTTTISDYSLVDDAEHIESYLITKIGADAEANRYNDLISSEHYVYSFEGYPHLLTYNLGDNVTLSSSRYGLNSTDGVIVSMSRNWISGRVTVGVLV